jgi:ABC-type lipoprotein export system ATPase subunit
VTPCFTLRRARKTYRPRGQPETVALDDLSIALPWGARIGVLGHSGAGKSTLLHLLGLLDEPDGTPDSDILYHESDQRALSYLGRTDSGVAPLTEADRDRLKKQVFGFVFQRGHLLEHLTAGENVALKALLAGTPAEQRGKRARVLLEYLGLQGKEANRPDQLSGGEAQRVAVLRALATAPRVVFADEPTGNLDRDNARDVLALLVAWQKAGKTEPRTLILVTHQLQDAWQYCTHFLILERGGAKEPELIARESLADEAALLQKVATCETETTRPDAPPLETGDPPRRLRLTDYWGLAWRDLLRRGHWITSTTTMLVLLFMLFLALVGLALGDGMNQLVTDRLTSLQATTLVVDGLARRDKVISDELTEKLKGLRLKNGALAFPPERGGVHRFNLLARQFRLYREDGTAGPLAPSPVRGRSAQEDDPDLLAVLPGGFSGDQAREIVVTRSFLVDGCQAPADAGVIYLEVKGQGLGLKVRAVVESIRGGYSYILPDGFATLIESQHFDPQPLGKGIILAGVGDAPKLRESVLADADLERRLTESNLEVEAAPGQLILRLAGGQNQRQDVLTRLGNTWVRLLAQRSLIEAKKVHLEHLPVPAEVVSTPSYGRAILRVRHADDLEEVATLLTPLDLSVSDDVMSVLQLLQRTIRPLGWAIGVIVGLALLVGLLNLAVTMAQRVREKTPEIGILKAHGMTTGQLGWLFALEGCLLILPAALLALLAGYGLSIWLNAQAVAANWPPLIRFDLVWLGGVALLAVVLAPLVCWAVTLGPASIPPAKAVA